MGHLTRTLRETYGRPEVYERGQYLRLYSVGLDLLGITIGQIILGSELAYKHYVIFQIPHLSVP